MEDCKCFHNLGDKVKRNKRIAAISDICLKKALDEGNLDKAERHFMRKEKALLNLKENFINLKGRQIVLERLSKYTKKRAERYIEEFGEDHRFTKILKERSENLQNMADFFKSWNEKFYPGGREKDD